ncbi:hypothetical protein ACQU0X_31995 [Pseudovibrio ascidiaceicola]|uniref:hypothetical protein n=1 Tax=Pseudovibrio ascidiaceicola TaxID=285279 RepID=UPI003D360221
MLNFDVNVSGSAVGEQLQGDTEELAYALVAISDNPQAQIGADVAEHICDQDDKQSVISLLKCLLEALSD